MNLRESQLTVRTIKFADRMDPRACSAHAKFSDQTSKRVNPSVCQYVIGGVRKRNRKFWFFNM